MNQAAKVQDAKGPLVWLDMDQRRSTTLRQLVTRRTAIRSTAQHVQQRRVRARLGAPKRIAYARRR